MARIPFDPVMTSPTKRVPWFESLVPCLGLLAWLGASSLASSALAADPSDVTRRDPYRSCRLNCLAILAHLQNVHVPLGSIEERLKPRDNEKRAFLARVGKPPAWSGWAARVPMVVAIGALAWWVRPRRPSGEARRPDMDPVVEVSPRSPDNERMEKTG